MGVIGNRLLVLRRFAAWLVSKWFMRLWAALGAYDLVCSQLLPDALLARAPTLKTVIELTAGLMTLTGWVIVGAALTILAGAECQRSA